MQRVSKRGLAEIAAHEGIVTSPYLDSVKVWTVGIGHTAAAGDPDPSRNRREFSVAEIMEIFARDISKYEAGVRKAFTAPLSQEQFDAAVSFHFNTGAIGRATWVKKFNAGDVAGARKSFMDWRKPKEIIPRREKERDLFFDGRYSSAGAATLYPANAVGAVQWSEGKRVNVLALMSAAEPPEPVPAPEPAPKPQPAPAAKPDAKAGIVAFVIGVLITAGIWVAALPCSTIGLFCGD